jgi:hypothetical protein
MRNNISIILLCTLPDPGIKSLGSKCLININKKPLLHHQIETIQNYFHGKNYEIILSLYFDANKVAKSIEHNKHVKIIKHNYSVTNQNINFGGALVSCLNHTFYDDILFINYGCVYNKNVLKKICHNTHNDNLVGVLKSKYIDNINLGCYVNDSYINNIFFDLTDIKYSDMVYLNKQTKQHIQNTFSVSKTINKFTFEIINTTIEQGYLFKPVEFSDKDYIFINNLKTLNKSKRILNHAVSKTKS